MGGAASKKKINSGTDTSNRRPRWPAVGRWNNNDAASKFVDLYRMFGKPNSLANAPHGAAVWLNVTGKRLFGSPTCFKDVMLIDESIQHNCPTPHKDFLYMTTLLDLTPEERDQVTRISGSVWYDGLKKELTVRCGSVAANVATMYIVMQMLSRSVSLETVQNQNLYAQALADAMDPAKAAQMHTDICKAIAARGPVTLTGFYPGAFTADCAPPTPPSLPDVTTANATIVANSNRTNGNYANGNRKPNSANGVRMNSNLTPNAPNTSGLPDATVLPDNPDVPDAAGAQMEKFHGYLMDGRGGEFDGKFY